MWLSQGKRLGLSIGRDSGFFSILRNFLAMYHLQCVTCKRFDTNEKKGRGGGEMEESNFLEQLFERRGGFQQVETSGKPFQNGRKALRKGVGAYTRRSLKFSHFPIHTVQIDSLQSTFHPASRMSGTII